MDNKVFCNTIKASFNEYLHSGSRSNSKLLPLHGRIAKDLHQALGGTFKIDSLGFGSGKEGKIDGRYYEKTVDIVVSKNGKVVAGVGVKFIMQNYSQNSVNYFENMLGETANIRSKRTPYFQMIIIPETVPYFKSNNDISKWETLTNHNVSKYVIMSADNPASFFHSPDKTLLFVIGMPSPPHTVKNKDGFIEFYKTIMPDMSIVPSSKNFGKFDSGVVLNNYPDFISKVSHRILSI